MAPRRDSTPFRSFSCLVPRFSFRCLHPGPGRTGSIPPFLQQTPLSHSWAGGALPTAHAEAAPWPPPLRSGGRVEGPGGPQPGLPLPRREFFFPLGSQGRVGMPETRREVGGRPTHPPSLLAGGGVTPRGLLFVSEPPIFFRLTSFVNCHGHPRQALLPCQALAVGLGRDLMVHPGFVWTSPRPFVPGLTEPPPNTKAPAPAPPTRGWSCGATAASSRGSGSPPCGCSGRAAGW